MLRFVLKSERYALIVAVLAAVAFVVLAPDNPLHRVWWGLGYSMLLPTFVVGRSARRLRDSWLSEALLQRKRFRLVASDWGVNLLYVCLTAYAFSWGHGASFLVCFSWALLVVAISESLDRALVVPSRVWVWTILLVGGLVVSPILMAPVYGNTPLAPNVVTYTVGLHPGAMYLTAHGLPTLQNPILYAVSLVGVIEAYPVKWQIGAGTYFALAVVSIAWSFVVPLRRKAILR